MVGFFNYYLLYFVNGLNMFLCIVDMFFLMVVLFYGKIIVFIFRCFVRMCFYEVVIVLINLFIYKEECILVDFERVKGCLFVYF